MCIVKKFKWPAVRRDQSEDGEQKDAILIQFDDDTIGYHAKNADGDFNIACHCDFPI